MKKLLLGLILIPLLGLAAPPTGTVGNRQFFATHITTNTTVTMTSKDTYIYSLVATSTNAGTSWVLQVRNKEGTPKVVYTAAGAGGSVSVGKDVFDMSAGVLMLGGVDIVTTGTTPGVVDVFITYEGG